LQGGGQVGGGCGRHFGSGGGRYAAELRGDGIEDVAWQRRGINGG
jgi:hypothetical protein